MPERTRTGQTGGQDSLSAHGYSDDFWRLSALQQAVVIRLSRDGNPMQEGEIKSGWDYSRSLAPTLRGLIRRGFVARVAPWEFALTDSGRVMMGLPSSRPQLRVIDGGAA